MNVVIFVAVDEFFERFLTLTLSYLGVKLTPRGEFVLEKFFIKKEGSGKNAYLSPRFQKMSEDFFRKQNHRGASAQIFFTIVVEKPLKKVRIYTPTYVPFTAKIGHFRQSCKVKSCIRFS